jgi:hypothetical protein
MRHVKEVKEYPCPERESATIRETLYTDGTSEITVSGDCWGCDYFSVWMKCTKYEKRVYE